MVLPVPAKEVIGTCLFALEGNMCVPGKLIWLEEKTFSAFVLLIEQTPEGLWEQGREESMRTAVLQTWSWALYTEALNTEMVLLSRCSGI